jgi:hypothetical protein
MSEEKTMMAAKLLTEIADRTIASQAARIAELEKETARLNEGWRLANVSLFEAGQAITLLASALDANHKWHIAHDDYDGYQESDLCEQNMKALGAEALCEDEGCPQHGSPHVCRSSRE